MKTVIASDIHGSAYYCGLLAEAVKSEGADCLLLLGDGVAHRGRQVEQEGEARAVVAEGRAVVADDGVNAVAEGKLAATAIHEYLMGGL